MCACGVCVGVCCSRRTSSPTELGAAETAAAFFGGVLCVCCVYACAVRLSRHADIPGFRPKVPVAISSLPSCCASTVPGFAPPLRDRLMDRMVKLLSARIPFFPRLRVRVESMAGCGTSVDRRGTLHV